MDNVFLLSYLPYADPVDVKIYLLGLALAGDASEDNSLEKMSLALKLDAERIENGFRYWEEKGIVSVSKTVPMTVKYLSVKNPLKPVVKIHGEKYKVFADEVARLFPEKILSPNEYNEFFELMHEFKMETNAMLLIMQYCKELGGSKFSPPYILKVATDWAEQGLTTETKVTEHIRELENNSEDIRLIFSALGIKRAADISDRQLYLKWTKKLKFPLDGVLTAARSLKRRGGMEKLDGILDELSSSGAYSAIEIDEYLKEKEKIHNLAKEMAAALGTYYGNTDAVVDTYVRPWLNMGFDGESLKKLAKFCFLRSVRTFDGLAQTVDRFYKNGVINAGDIDSFVTRQLKIDDEIREIFEKCNRLGVVGNRDRECYRTWTEWGFSKEAILAAAETCAAESFPMQSLTRKLSFLKGEGIFEPEKIKNSLSAKPDQTKKQSNNDYMTHEYTEEQLRNVLINFDDWGN